jgi:isopentenyl-diphosphate delta-isomerase
MILERDKVVLVNERDEWQSIASKEDVHRSGALHRALSIFIVNARGELLLQQRAAEKYHSGGLWSNACCSHPAPNEATIAAAHRRLQEELGFDTELTPAGTFLYRAEVGEGLIEHEFDHLFTGSWNGDMRPAPAEVSAIQWIKPEALDTWMQREPQQFTAWFPILLQAWRVNTGHH